MKSGEGIKMRIAAGNQCYYGLQHLFRSRTVSRTVKITIYKTILKPIVMFGCKAWPMTEKDKTRLNMWERKILRKVYGPVTEQGVWRITRNEELRELYKAPNLVVDIERKELKWLGHAIRMDQRRVVSQGASITRGSVLKERNCHVNSKLFFILRIIRLN
jgi:hypothetical protein